MEVTAVLGFYVREARCSFVECRQEELNIGLAKTGTYCCYTDYCNGSVRVAMSAVLLAAVVSLSFLLHASAI